MTEAVHPQTASNLRLAELGVWLGLGYLISISFPTFVSLPGSVAPSHLILALSLPIWIGASLQRVNSPFHSTTSSEITFFLSCSGLMILLCFLSAFVAADPFRVTRWVLSFFTSFGMFLLARSVPSHRWVSRLLLTECAALAFVSVLSVAAMWHGGLREIIYMGADRASGFFKNPNQFGIAISTLLPVAVAMLLGQQRKMIWSIITFLLIFGLITSGSKTNLMISSASTLAMLITYCIIAYKGMARAGMMLLVILGYAFACLIFILAISILNPRALALLTLFFQGGSPHSIVSRGVLWERSFELFANNPLTGIGAGQPILPHVSHSHNVVIEASRAMGAPGLVLILIFLATLLIISARNMAFSIRQTSPILDDRLICCGSALGIVSYIAANLVSDSFGPTTSPFLYSVLFLGLSCRNYEPA